jgi:carbon-monoxide dehydrogenase medium subunit
VGSVGRIDVKAAPFVLARPESLEEVIAALVEHGDEARVIAGGQSLGPLMALRLAAPEVLVDLARVPGLDRIEVRSDGSTAIGAMVRQRTVERDARVASSAPLLAQAVPFIGHIAVRTQGTVCGSVAHADPAAELPAVALATDATMVLVGQRGERRVAADDFFTGYYSTAIEHGEVLREVVLPRCAPRSGSAFVELSRRHGDFALVGAAVVVTLDEEGTVVQARVALSGVASHPFRAVGGETALVGARPTVEAIADAAAAVRGEVDPSADLHATGAYRRHLAGVLVGKALSAAVERASAAA